MDFFGLIPTVDYLPILRQWYPGLHSCLYQIDRDCYIVLPFNVQAKISLVDFFVLIPTVDYLPILRKFASGTQGFILSACLYQIDRDCYIDAVYCYLTHTDKGKTTLIIFNHHQLPTNVSPAVIAI